MSPLGTALLLAWATVGQSGPEPSSRTYVVPAQLAAGRPGTGLWRPTLAEAIAARSALRRYLRSAAPLDRGLRPAQVGAILSRFDAYVIQAEGVRAASSRENYGTEGGGPRQIHLDGYAPEIAKQFGDRVGREMQVITDGDNGVFHATYDVGSRRIVDFQISGIA